MNETATTRLDIDSRHPLAAIAEIQRAYDLVPDHLKSGAVLFTGNHDIDGARGPELWSGGPPLNEDGGTSLISKDVYPRSKYRT